jgi:hypothetical protein
VTATGCGPRSAVDVDADHRDESVDAAGDQQQVEHEAAERHPAGEQPSAPRRALGARHEQQDRHRHQRDAEGGEHAVRRRLLADHELRNDLPDAAPPRRGRDPARVPGGVLADRVGEQRHPTATSAPTPIRTARSWRRTTSSQTTSGATTRMA